MAKKSSIEKNDRRKQLTQRYAAKRKALKAVILNVHASDEEKMAAQFALQRLPRNSSKTRIRNRCQMTGRPRVRERVRPEPHCHARDGAQRVPARRAQGELVRTGEAGR